MASKANARKFSMEDMKLPSVVRKFSHRTCTGFIPGNPNKVN